MAVNLAALKTEIQTDPLTYGYAPLVAANRPGAVAELLSRIRDGTDGEAAITVRRADISSQEIVQAIDVADYTALPGSPTAAQLSAERRYLAWLTLIAAAPTVRLLADDGSNTPVVANLLAMFPASGTRTRLLALASRFGSRSEQLFGTGTLVTSTDVIEALES
jgi:hypothetical protein